MIEAAKKVHKLPFNVNITIDVLLVQTPSISSHNTFKISQTIKKNYRLF